MNRSRRVDNSRAQEKSKKYFLQKINANLETGFFGNKTGFVIEYPHRFKAAAISHDTKEQTGQIRGKSLSERQRQSIDP